VIAYLDTSAAMRLLVDEAESDALAAHLTSATTSGRHRVVHL
jgi:predicted nucleic acid-binding protein